MTGRAESCNGEYRCKATEHIHGCYAEKASAKASARGVDERLARYECSCGWQYHILNGEPVEWVHQCNSPKGHIVAVYERTESIGG